MKTKILLTTLMWSLALCQNAQMPLFYFAPKVIEVDASPCSISSLGVSSIYFRSTGIYDFINGTHRFYINDATVYDGASQTPVGTLPTIPGYDNYQAEIVIIPVPGACDKFFAFYCLTQGPSDGQAVVYVTIDCSGAAVTVSGPTTAFTSHGNGSGLAASKRIGSGSSAYYYLYSSYVSPVANNNRIYALKITSIGVASKTDIGYASLSLADSPKELELSEDGNWIAFNPNIAGVRVIHLSSPTSFGSEQVYGYTNSTGIEFVGTVTGTPKLYVCGPSYFDEINLTTQVATPKLSGLAQYNLDNTMLEYDGAQQLCGFCDYNGSRWFVEYDPSANSVHGTPVTVNPNSTHSSVTNNVNSFGGSIYYMPDQIDGEDYQNFSTIPHVFVSGLNLNGGVISTNCGTWIEVYNCNKIDLATILTGGGACESWIDITNYDHDCNPQSGTGFFNYSGKYTINDDGTIPTTDIRDCYSKKEQSFYTTPGYYGVTVHIRDCCGHESSMTCYINVLGSLVGTNLEISDNNPNPPNPQHPWFPASTSISSPVNVGSSSLAYQVALSSGNITGYTTLIQEVDNTGAVTGAGTIYNKTINTNNINSIGTQNLTTLCIDASIWPAPYPTSQGCSSTNPNYSGYYGYWSTNNGQNSYQKYYKINVTLFNPCSTSSAYSYIYVNSVNNRPANTTGIEDNIIQTGVQVFPNPANNELFISFPDIISGELKVELIDLMGRSVLKYAGKPETNRHSLDISKLPTGMYIWKCETDLKSTTGKIEIVR